MEYNIKEKKQNALLSRTELSIEIKHFNTANPSYKNITKEIAKQLKADEKLVVVKHVYPAFGEGKSDVTAYVYENEEALARVEPQEIKKRAEAEKKAAEKKEAPKEEKKEASKEEAAPAEAKPDAQEQAPAEKPAEASAKETKEEAAPEEKKKEPAKKETPKEKAKPEGEK